MNAYVKVPGSAPGRTATPQAIVLLDPATGLPYAATGSGGGGGGAASGSGVTASDGVVLPIDSLAQTMGYTAGNLTSVTVTYGASTYVQTLTYTSGNLTGVSKWVKQ